MKNSMVDLLKDYKIMPVSGSERSFISNNASISVNNSISAFKLTNNNESFNIDNNNKNLSNIKDNLFNDSTITISQSLNSRSVIPPAVIAAQKKLDFKSNLKSKSKAPTQIEFTSSFYEAHNLNVHNNSNHDYEFNEINNKTLTNKSIKFNLTDSQMKISHYAGKSRDYRINSSQSVQSNSFTKVYPVTTMNTNNTGHFVTNLYAELQPRERSREVKRMNIHSKIKKGFFSHFGFARHKSAETENNTRYVKVNNVSNQTSSNSLWNLPLSGQVSSSSIKKNNHEFLSSFINSSQRKEPINLEIRDASNKGVSFTKFKLDQLDESKLKLEYFQQSSAVIVEPQPKNESIEKKPSFTDPKSIFHEKLKHRQAKEKSKVDYKLTNNISYLKSDQQASKRIEAKEYYNQLIEIMKKGNDKSPAQASTKAYAEISNNKFEINNNYFGAIQFIPTKSEKLKVETAIKVMSEMNLGNVNDLIFLLTPRNLILLVNSKTLETEILETDREGLEDEISFDPRSNHTKSERSLLSECENEKSLISNKQCVLRFNSIFRIETSSVLLNLGLEHYNIVYSVISETENERSNYKSADFIGKQYTIDLYKLKTASYNLGSKILELVIEENMVRASVRSESQELSNSYAIHYMVEDKAEGERLKSSLLYLSRLIKLKAIHYKVKLECDSL